MRLIVSSKAAFEARYGEQTRCRYQKKLVITVKNFSTRSAVSIVVPALEV